MGAMVGRSDSHHGNQNPCSLHFLFLVFRQAIELAVDLQLPGA